MSSFVACQPAIYNPITDANTKPNAYSSDCPIPRRGSGSMMAVGWCSFASDCFNMA